MMTEWHQQQEQLLMQHPFLTPSSVGSRRSSAGLPPPTPTPAATWPSETRTPRRILETRTTDLFSSPLSSQEEESSLSPRREEEATRVLLQRAEAAHSVAVKEVARLEETCAHLEAAKRRAEQLASDETERRKAAEACAKSRQKDLANERWRADDVSRALRRLEVDFYDAEAKASVREREISRLETKSRRLEDAERLLAASTAETAEARDEAKRQKARAEAAEERARESSAEISRLKLEMKANLDAEHERGEKAREAIKARAERDRERARIAEINAANKAQELLQLWQRFKLLQSASNDNGEDRRASGTSSNNNNNNSYANTEDDDDNASAITTQTQQDALRAKIDQARKGLKSSQRKLSERRQSGGSSS